MFDLQGTERLAEWKRFRDELETSPDPLKDVARFWGRAPFVSQFLDKNEERLAEEYNRDNKFQTSVRGFINRGNFSTAEEAEKYAKELRDRNPNNNTHSNPY